MCTKSFLFCLLRAKALRPSSPHLAAALCLLALLGGSNLQADFTNYVGPTSPSPGTFGLTVTNRGAVQNSTGTTPFAGTPAYSVFNGRVTFVNAPLSSVAASRDAVVGHVLSRLNPFRRY